MFWHWKSFLCNSASIALNIIPKDQNFDPLRQNLMKKNDCLKQFSQNLNFLPKNHVFWRFRALFVHTQTFSIDPDHKKLVFYFQLWPPTQILSKFRPKISTRISIMFRPFLEPPRSERFTTGQMEKENSYQKLKK